MSTNSVDNRSSTSIKNSQVIAIVKTLDKSEIREFRKWLQSPVHNQREDVVQLFEYLVAANHLYEDKFLEKERIFRKIFSKEAYNDAKLRQTNHFLTRCLEEYLSYKEWQENEINCKLRLVTQFRKRKLSKPFKRTVRAIQQEQENSPYRNDQYFRNEYRIQLELYDFLHERMRTPKNNLQEISDTLDRNYIIEKLRLSCRMIFHEVVHKTGLDFGPLNEILDYIEAHDLFTEPVIAVYYYIFKAVTDVEHDQKYFENLRHEVHSNGNMLEHSEKREVYLMAINYCIRKMNAGVKEFIREAYEWYKQGFENLILIEDNAISRWTYLNVILIALKLKEFKWTEYFIEKYKHYVASAHRENFSHFSRAKLLFEQKKYDEAHDLLIYFEYDDILINLNAKSMLLKIYYETDEFNLLESFLESMRTYLKRKEIQSYHKANYQNILRYTKKLLRIKPYDDKQKEKLRSEISAASPLTEKEWLLEQLEKL